ncbi:hypothetical protein K788_0007644 [Paraburkholderia caribensis MBA4]|uniref:Uncharacterized protein n=1 Tax=Paraburkholderia caribensis MBA4 TaxID=1323664 RepID=A0A0P0RGW1_9BURK|nr:hypothetical protein K788_0007644 [Paraburkholderia caribensis MBA4]
MSSIPTFMVHSKEELKIEKNNLISLILQEQFQSIPRY